MYVCMGRKKVSMILFCTPFCVYVSRAGGSLSAIYDGRLRPQEYVCASPPCACKAGNVYCYGAGAAVLSNKTAGVHHPNDSRNRVYVTRVVACLSCGGGRRQEVLKKVGTPTCGYAKLRRQTTQRGRRGRNKSHHQWGENAQIEIHPISIVTAVGM